MSIEELFEIIDNPAGQVQIARVLKTQSSQTYAIALQFFSPELVENFIYKYQGKKYNFMEDQTISIFKISQMLQLRDGVFLIHENDSGVRNQFPDL